MPEARDLFTNAGGGSGDEAVYFPVINVHLDLGQFHCSTVPESLARVFQSVMITSKHLCAQF